MAVNKMGSTWTRWPGALARNGGAPTETFRLPHKVGLHLASRHRIGIEKHSWLDD